jgi:hypothetical protein
MLTSMFSLTYVFTGGLLGLLMYFPVSLAIGALFGLVVGHCLARRDLATTEESLTANRR